VDSSSSIPMPKNLVDVEVVLGFKISGWVLEVHNNRFNLLQYPDNEYSTCMAVSYYYRSFPSFPMIRTTFHMISLQNLNMERNKNFKVKVIEIFVAGG
jgi:hypothetical protein